jgi:hypothetical protein
MHFTELRKRAAIRGLATLLALIVCAGAADWGHTGWDDPACDPVPVLHDHSAHRFRPASEQAPPSDGHCYLCHALRLLHMSLTAHAVAAIPAAGGAFYRTGVEASISRAVAHPTLPRAPPAALL